MTERKTASGLDFEEMRRAIEECDAEALIGLYAGGAEMKIVNKNTTPNSPRILRGKEEIAGYLRDVCGREMTHRVENAVIGEDRAAFTEACEYPGGMKVLAATTLEVWNGRISRQLTVEAWDE
ncbi:nuclear transport factor 2 family protein [Rubrobacter taiwanensis]|jgi:hypothetical protein|uniref:Nuclear transport factor 2 family protein n=1 Tax=Rubrobacter taiwanensis TaxID=185139 RepID=A0A4R1BGW0_9ACTN|nr:nuclear transport factor 2 family protein [Rubrobacter taiwanensis]TCJ16404.1 nuclear transport factor 2 family protein [Rubrobacter taiwanensis]